MWILSEDIIIKVFILLIVLNIQIIFILYIVTQKKRTTAFALFMIFLISSALFVLTSIIESVIFIEHIRIFFVVIQKIEIALIIYSIFLGMFYVMRNKFKRIKTYYGLPDYTAIVKSISDPMIIVDYQGKVVESNHIMSKLVSASDIASNLCTGCSPDQKIKINHWIRTLDIFHQFEITYNNETYLLISTPIKTRFKGFLGTTVVLHNIQLQKILNLKSQGFNEELVEKNKKLQKFMETIYLYETEKVRHELLKHVQKELVDGIQTAIRQVDSVIKEDEIYNEDDYIQLTHINDQIRQVLHKIRETAKKIAIQ